MSPVRSNERVMSDYVRARLDELLSQARADGSFATSDEDATRERVSFSEPPLWRGEQPFVEPGGQPPTFVERAQRVETGFEKAPRPARPRSVEPGVQPSTIVERAQRVETQDSPRPPMSPERVPAGDGAPAPVPAYRFGLTRQHVMVLVGVLLVGVIIAAVALTRARAISVEPEPVAPQAPFTPLAPVTPTSGMPSPTAAPRVRVHVVGAVRRPGVHELAQGARVADAIEAAGGLTEKARPGELNLAQPVTDGQQIVIGDQKEPGGEVRGPRPAEPGPDADSGAPGSVPTGPQTGAVGKVNLNTATAAQLDALPGVGPVTAQKIVAWRTQHQRFTRVEELMEVPGIGPKTFAELSPHVTV